MSATSTNPFWPYPRPGLPPGHRVWRWLAGIDAGPWEDASTVLVTPFRSKIVGHRRVLLVDGDPEGENPATFGLYPPAGQLAGTVRTLPSTPATSHQTGATQSHNNPDNSSEATPELGRSYKPEGNMAFQNFSDEPSPIRGNFIPVSSPVTYLSPTPHQRVKTRDRVHETITESEEEYFQDIISRGKMQYQRAQAAQQGVSTPAKHYEPRDALISGSSRSRSRSPVKHRDAATPSTRSRSSSPVKKSSRLARHGEKPRVSFTFEDDAELLTSAVYAPPVKKNRYEVSPLSSRNSTQSISRRRSKPDPVPIDVATTKQEAKAEALRKGEIPIVVHVPQPDQSTDFRFRPTFITDDTSSAYSQDVTYVPDRMSVDPLQVIARSPNNQFDVSRQSVFDSYNEWKQGLNRRSGGFQEQPIDDEDDYHAQKKAMEKSLKTTKEMSKSEQAGYKGEPYSPLDTMFPDVTVSGSARKASKTMIGDRGWLEDTSFSPQKRPAPKNIGFFENLRKKAKGLVNMGSDQLRVPRPASTPKKGHKERLLVVSLDPREQSLVYSELEFLLASALNTYIASQFNNGRLDADKLKKISDGWQQKGRPKVVGFRYDLETQLDLIRMHVEEFRFYCRQTTTAAIYGIVDMMRSNARAMRIRTYCQPDTVISKQLLDTQNLMNILGCTQEEHMLLASITKFFQGCLKRDKVFHYEPVETVPDSVSSRYADHPRHLANEDSVFASPNNRSFVATPQSRRSGRERMESPGPQRQG